MCYIKLHEFSTYLTRCSNFGMNLLDVQSSRTRLKILKSTFLTFIIMIISFHVLDQIMPHSKPSLAYFTLMISSFNSTRTTFFLESKLKKYQNCKFTYCFHQSTCMHAYTRFKHIKKNKPHNPLNKLTFNNESILYLQINSFYIITQRKAENNFYLQFIKDHIRGAG